MVANDIFVLLIRIARRAELVKMTAGHLSLKVEYVNDIGLSNVWMSK